VSLPPLTIVLSTYNGEKFIAEQIASIQRQTHSDWRLLLRDDGSSDRTLEIVRAMAEVDRRITLLPSGPGNLGPAASFGVLLEQALSDGAEYVSLADQDDVWLPTKLAAELELVRRQEAAAGRSTPILVHSDLTVVAENLSLVHPSFLARQGLKHVDKFSLGPLLIQNFVTGSTVVLNRALLQVVVPIPGVIMHDWWLALCAAALGRIAFLPEPTVLYRQHGSNALGSVGQKRAVWRSLRNPIAAWLRADELLAQTLGQARELLKRVEPEEKRNPAAARSLPVLRDFCGAFAQTSGLKRLRVVARHRIRPRTFLPYPVRFYAGVLLWSRSS
jgi:rhamnosyltransferase